MSPAAALVAIAEKDVTEDWIAMSRRSRESPGAPY
jgi:hypothetical protein